MVLGGLDLPTIIVAAADAVTQGYAAASPSVDAAAPSVSVLSPLKLLHLFCICGLATDADTHQIWMEVCRAPTKAAALAVLSQYLWAGREFCRRELFGSADMLHVCGSLFMFVHGDWFVNPRHNPAYPDGGMSFWTTHQDGGNVGLNIASTEGIITALDGANVRHEEVTTVTQTKLAFVVGLLMTEMEMGTHAYVLQSLLGEA